MSKLFITLICPLIIIVPLTFLIIVSILNPYLSAFFCKVLKLHLPPDDATIKQSPNGKWNAICPRCKKKLIFIDGEWYECDD